MNEDNYDFSFSGIKTSVLYWLKKQPPPNPFLLKEGENDNPLLKKEGAGGGYEVRDIAASFQRAMVDILVTKTLWAAEANGIKDIVCVGGVSANSELRERFRMNANAVQCDFFVPRPLFSTDNAAMIAMLGALKLTRGARERLFACSAAALAISSSKGEKLMRLSSIAGHVTRSVFDLSRKSC